MVKAGSVLDLKWLVSLGRKIAVVVLWKTALIVCLTLISQISAILASLLPLKVIILLGSDGMPRYIPESLAVYGKDTLIVAFSLVTAGFFITHLLIENVIGRVTNKAKDDLLKKSKKIIIFENQDDIAADAYLRFSRAFSGGVFFLSGYVALFLIYPDMVLVISVYIMIAASFFLFRIKNSGKFYLKFENKFSALLRLAANLGFFAGFGFLILDFTVLSPPGIIVAIIAILLSRIMLQKLSGAVIDAVVLTQKRTKLEPLFFHGKAVSRPIKGKEGAGVWAMIENEVDSSIDFIFADYFESWNGCKSVRWVQTGVRDVAGFEVVEKSGERFFVKIFDRRRESLAIHEATLVGEGLNHLPAPELLATTEFNDLKCLIYRYPEGRRPDLEEIRQIPEIVRGRLMWVQPPESIIRTFLRSKPLLADKLESTVINKLRVCAGGPQEQRNIDLLAAHFIELQSFLRRLPLVIVLPDISPSSVLLTYSADDTCILNWGRWELDTIGSGWRIRPKRLERLGPSLVDAKQKRADLNGISTDEVELVAFVSAFEARCSRQLFADALEMLPEILVRIEKIGGIFSVHTVIPDGESIG
jgi:hypothetical protein